MKIMKAVFEFANGKKTWAGFFILVLSIAMHFVGGNPETATALQNAIDYLNTPEGASFVAGIMVFIVGLFDKFRKKVEK